MRHKFFILTAGLWALSGVPAHASIAQLKHANRLFVKGRYDGALKAYEDALVDAPQSSILHFNAGDAAYQTGDYSKAEKEFKEASQSAIPVLKAAAHYNLGNALFRQQRWADAVEAYKESLRVNPKDKDAKYNLMIALNAQKNPPSKPKDQNQKQGQGSAKDKSKNGNSGKQQTNSENQGASAKPGEMSKEDVDRLLAAARSGEIKKSNQKFPKSDVPHPDEDW